MAYERKGGSVVPFVAGSVTGALTALLLSKPVLAAPENSDAKLDYLIQLGELQAKALARLVEIAEAASGVPGLTPTADPRILTMLKAQFLTNPEAVCSLINSHEPNLVQNSSIAVNVTLAPGATTTLTAGVLAGFVHLFMSINLYTDIPFAVSGIVLMDGHLSYVDTGICPIDYHMLNWMEAASSWQIILTNNSLVNVNIHAYFGTWDIEAQTFNKIKAAIKPLSYAMAEYGSPDGGM